MTTTTPTWPSSSSPGLPETVRLYDFRHFLATRLISSDVDVRTVSGRLGHRRTSTTMDRYAAFVPAADRAAADILEVHLLADEAAIKSSPRGVRRARCSALTCVFFARTSVEWRPEGGVPPRIALRSRCPARYRHGDPV
jgi:hypothetical protein